IFTLAIAFAMRSMRSSRIADLLVSRFEGVAGADTEIAVRILDDPVAVNGLRLAVCGVDDQRKDRRLVVAVRKRLAPPAGLACDQRHVELAGCCAHELQSGARRVAVLGVELNGLYNNR